jgi:hypothetical protein
MISSKESFVQGSADYISKAKSLVAEMTSAHEREKREVDPIKCITIGLRIHYIINAE